MGFRSAVTAVLIAGAGFAHAATPPPGFVETPLAGTGGGGLSLPVAIAYGPEGDLWIVEQGGDVKIRDPATGDLSTALDLPCVSASGERGALGIAFDPDFLDGPSDRWVYVYYTRLVNDGACDIDGAVNGVRNQVSRFLESGGSLTDEEVLVHTGPLGPTNHNGGTVRFGNDGMLYVSIGDNDTDHLANPAARDLADLRGSLLRIEKDGSIPADNPFVGVAGVREEIWAWGLRNPYRFSIDPTSGSPFIADVGENAWEAIYVGVSGADYGYPCVEGLAPFRPCNPEPAPGSVVDPVYVYHHGSQTAPVSGRSITGGPVYRASAFPEDYRDNYFFADYVEGWIRRARVTPGLGLTDVETFLPDASTVADMAVSPAGCLTWVSRGSGVFDVCYDGDSDNDRDGYSPNRGDCDDTEASVYPGAPEICDGLDNDCAGGTDDGDCTDFDPSGDGRLDGVDLVWLGLAFGQCSATPSAEWWEALDYDRNTCVDGDDLAVLAVAFGCEGDEAICE